MESKMKDYSYIIDEVCTGAKTPHLVRQIIPILIGWAKKKETTHTYGELNKCIGYPNGNSSIGHQLGCVKDVLARLEKAMEKETKTSEHIPNLNALVSSSKTGLPSDGFSYVKPKYDTYDYEDKRMAVENINNVALNYDKWDWILALLGLKPAVNRDDEAKIRSGAFGFGGEGEEHKMLKEYIATHPKSIGIKSDEKGTNEHTLLSGDRLDVFFGIANVAVEVKPRSAPDADILRGIYQCVKYKAVLDAEAKVHGAIPNAKVILVIGGTLSKYNRSVQECLGVDVKENFVCH